MPQKKQEKKKPYFANTPAYRKKLAKGTKPGAAKKGTRVYKRKQAVVKAKKGLSKLAERLNPFDKESKERRKTRQQMRKGKKAGRKAAKATRGMTGFDSPPAKKKAVKGLTSASRARKLGVAKGTKVRKGAVGAEKTKGGEYVKYQKGSKSAGKFKSAFKSGCAGGAKSFKWDGRSYSCAKK